MKIVDFVSEAPLPPDWDVEQMKKQKGTTFKSRLAYALSKSTRLGAGSSRVAVKIEENGRPTVFKVAKNSRGEQQNLAEISILNDGYVKQLGIAIPLIDYDKAGDLPVWIQTELARVPKNEKELCNYFGCNYLHELVQYASSYRKRNGYSIQQQILKNLADTEKEEIFIDYAEKLAELEQFEVELVDFNNYKNWGFYQGVPVVIDIGYTKDVAELYRKRFR